MDNSTFDAVPKTLRSALKARGFSSLTPVQEAVLLAERGRDLRIFSQTGSGKTVAFGLLLARHFEDEPGGARVPRALVLAPTRELAQQVHRELTWLLAPLGARVLSVTGGTSMRNDLRALHEGADVVVGTPGRLADHVRTGALRCEAVEVVVLDEADEMLEMGFREELETALDAVPEDHRTHLVSATFADAVRALAERYQNEPIAIEATPLGDANADIDHLAYLVLRSERDDALVNLLLAAPDDVTLVFVKTREGASELVRKLREEGFGALLLTGDLDQRERQRTLEMFRQGKFRILVATDVAARGLDVPGIARVIHADPPDDPDAYTHRSGRTGRAGRKGTSMMLVPREAQRRIARLLAAAKVTPRWEKVPDAESILRTASERAYEAIVAEGPEPDETSLALAQRLVESLDPLTLATRLLSRPIPKLVSEPRTLTPVTAMAESPRRPPLARREAYAADGYVRFQVSWGKSRGADPRRLLAVLCRRGNVTKDAIGAIHIGFQSSFVEVRKEAAQGFETGASRPDPRDPHVRIRRAFDERPARPDRNGHKPRFAPKPEWKRPRDFAPGQGGELPPPRGGFPRGPRFEAANKERRFVEARWKNAKPAEAFPRKRRG